MPKEPLRVFDGNSKPYEPFWTLLNASESESGEPEMEFYGYISEYSWLADDITPKKFKDDLYKLGNKGPITIRINSGGGDVVCASVIRSTIVDYPGRVTMRIDGLCASAATWVATAGDVVKMQDTAFFMIHDPSMIVWGTIDDIKSGLELLETVKSGIIDAYFAKTKLNQEKLAKMMSDETWMTAKEAKNFGFIDEVIGVPLKAASNLAGQVAITNALRHYQHVPESLQQLINSQQAAQPVEVHAAVETAEAVRLRAEVKLYV